MQWHTHGINATDCISLAPRQHNHPTRHGPKSIKACSYKQCTATQGTPAYTLRLISFALAITTFSNRSGCLLCLPLHTLYLHHGPSLTSSGLRLTPRFSSCVLVPLPGSIKSHTPSCIHCTHLFIQSTNLTCSTVNSASQENTSLRDFTNSVTRHVPKDIAHII